ncbi:MAG: DUF2520 domain-containing protein [Deltaproteobacteria bacterium]|nr:DUF2520 domain-containing protein [Deltaproteobacteria bacterium]
MKVFIFGAGKAGTGVARGLQRAGWSVTLRAARRGLPRRVDADVVIIAVRDGRIPGVAKEMCGVVPQEAVVLHLAGGLGPEALDPLRGHCKGVGQLHPLLAFADLRRAPTLAGAFAHCCGDRAAISMGRTMAKAMGMRPATIRGLDLGAYHAAGGLVAAGAVGLVQAGVEVLSASGVDPRRAARMLAPLLRSVAENVANLGLPRALSGVVRRGDLSRARAHLGAIERGSASHVALYREVLKAQLPLAQELGEAAPGDLKQLSRWVNQASRWASGARSDRVDGGSSIRGR